MTELAPFQGYRVEVPEEWLDFNGHMHDAAYASALSAAHEELFEVLGLSATYRRSTGGALYTVEMLLRFLAECSRGDVLTARTLLVHADESKLHLVTELCLLPEPGDRHGRTIAVGEAFYLHVDTAHGATAAMPADRRGAVQELLSRHAGLPRPTRLRLGREHAGVGGR